MFNQTGRMLQEYHASHASLRARRVAHRMGDRHAGLTRRQRRSVIEVVAPAIMDASAAPDVSVSKPTQNGFDIHPDATLFDYLRVAPPCSLKLWLRVVKGGPHLEFRERNLAWGDALFMLPVLTVVEANAVVMAVGGSDTLGEQKSMAKLQRRREARLVRRCEAQASQGLCPFAGRTDAAVVTAIEDLLSDAAEHVKGGAVRWAARGRQWVDAEKARAAEMARGELEGDDGGSGSSNPVALCNGCTLGIKTTRTNIRRHTPSALRVKLAYDDVAMTGSRTFIAGAGDEERSGSSFSFSSAGTAKRTFGSGLGLRR
jgi:hypothetical protein